MDDRKEALTDLRAKIEAGEAEDWITYALAIGLRPDDRHIHAWNAYNGSLDAAKALHEAVLPGWEHGHDGSIAWVKRKGKRTSYRHNAQNGFTARAWLIAIIKALIAKAEA